MPLVVVLCLALAAAACDESVTGPTVPLNTEFTLAPGESATIERADLEVRFDRVTGDSRCPIDAVCIQGGSAAVHITAVSTGAPRQYQLMTGDMKPVRHDDNTIAIVDLTPYPFSTRTIQQDEYRVTLKVTR